MKKGAIYARYSSDKQTEETIHVQIDMRHISAALNREGIPAPGGNTWDVLAVSYILLNETYRGWRIWNKTKKVRKPDGKKTYRHRPRKEWIIQKDAHPAIIDTELWEAVEAARQRKERFHAHGGGKRTPHSVYLLTGLVKCGQCGGNFIVHKARGPHPTRRYFYYRCSYHERRGNAVCANNTTLHRDRLEAAVLDLLRREVLTKNTVRVIVEEVQKAWKTLQQDGPEKNLTHIERELRKVERELAHLVQAIKTTGICATLRAELERTEARKEELEQHRQELLQCRPQALCLPTEREIAAELADLRALLESGTPQERRAILEENIEQILVQPTGETLLKANPAGLLPLPDFSIQAVPGAGLEPARDFTPNGF